MKTIYKIKRLLSEIRSFGYMLINKKESLVWDISVTDVCNARCIFCPYQYKKPTGRVVSFKEVEKFLKIARIFNVKKINFTPLTGDALLDKDLLLKGKLVKKYRFKSYLFTNGIRLNKFSCNDLFSSFDSIHISMGGLERGIYKKTYGVDEFDTVFNNLKELVKYKEMTNSKVEIHIEFREISPYSFMKAELYGQVKNWIEKGLIRVGTFESFDSIHETINLPFMNIRSKPYLLALRKYFPCKQLKVFALMHNGDIRMCNCVTSDPINLQSDDLLVGNIKDTEIGSWKRILEDKTKRSRALWRKNKIPEQCRACTLYSPAWANTKNIG